MTILLISLNIKVCILIEDKSYQIRGKTLNICCVQETHFKPKDTSGLKRKEGKNNCHANSNQKKSKEALLMLDKIDFK